MLGSGGRTNAMEPRIRVLTRPPPPYAAAPAAVTNLPSSFPPNPAGATPSITPVAAHPPDGVVVVGFLASSPAIDAAHIVNRLLDAHVFGSGGLDKDLLPGCSDGAPVDGHMKFSYHYEEEKGIVFLLFSSSLSPAVLLSQSPADGGEGSPLFALEESEAGGLRGMLFLFSVCHVIIFLHEGICFDARILRKFRILHRAKQALLPFFRSQIAPIFVPTVSPSVPLQRTATSAPPGRRGGIGNRNSSAISLMSGLGSHQSVLPGQCAPVVLFVFVYDFGDYPHSGNSQNLEGTADSLSVNTPSNFGTVPRPNLNLKASGSLVLLARPSSKTEGNFKKKLQSSLETQIRFLIKKCRILVSGEAIHLGSKGSGIISSLPLFSLDATKIVALLDMSMNQSGETLNHISGIIEAAFNSKDRVDFHMLESHCQSLNSEDIQLVKDFIFRQSDLLRGRGGMPSNNSGSVAGVGMVAAAAAAAAVSAAAGKPMSAPELPTMRKWLSAISQILEVTFYRKQSFAALELQNEQIPQVEIAPLETIASCLENNTGLNMKFSTSWCLQALSSAKEVYLKDLPSSYPTFLHESQVEKALQAFLSMVKGPAVQAFAKKLKDECILIWENGRQLCDAVSLTGNPCMHQRHTCKSSDSSSQSDATQHSSGHSSGCIFLHACACGRSRCLREDPFDFYIANSGFNCFSNCENLLPRFVFPEESSPGSLSSTSWSLVRLGGAKYYKPSKGLFQVGFCSTEKYLLRWTISFGSSKDTTSFPASTLNKVSLLNCNNTPKPISPADGSVKESSVSNHTKEATHGRLENIAQSSKGLSSVSSSISFGNGLPSFTLKKPFSEVVAGGPIVDAKGSKLQLQKQQQPKSNPEKDKKQLDADNRTSIHHGECDDHIELKKGDYYSMNGNSVQPLMGSASGDPFLQIGSNLIPVNIHADRNTKLDAPANEIIVYVGFEHECPYGHRFLLSPEHLSHLEVSYEEYHSMADDSGSRYQDAINAKNHSSSSVATCINDKMRIAGQQNGQSTEYSKTSETQSVNGSSMSSDSLGGNPESFSHVTYDDGGPAFSLLNRNLPVYMNCPHCRSLKRSAHQNTKFANTVSQLQRIIVVTPPFPLVLATCPIIKFQESCLFPIRDSGQHSQFSLGCQVILPPESFVTLRLPFVYGIKMADGSLHPLKFFEQQPELSACVIKGTALYVVSKEHAVHKMGAL